jgi:hypothetical protein
LQGAEHQLVGVERRQHDHRRRVGLRAQQARGGDAVGLRHADVHQHDVRAMAIDGCEHPAAVVGFADHLDPGGSGEQHPQARAHERVVVDEHDPDAPAWGFAAGAAMLEAAAATVSWWAPDR